MPPSNRLLLASLIILPTAYATSPLVLRAQQNLARTGDVDIRHVATCMSGDPRSSGVQRWRREGLGHDAGWSGSHRGRRSRGRSFGGGILTDVRGGSTAEAQSERDGQQTTAGPRDIKVLVSTTKISSYVDARGEVSARSDWTVERLREELEQKFPGKIPASLQRLFKGTQLLQASMTLEEVSEGAEGPISLLLDNAPPIDATRFDPDTVVPSRREGQVEAFSACLAAQSCLQDTLLAAMRGNAGQDDTELTRSVRMKADFENTQALLKRTLQEVPDCSGVDPPQTFGVLHEALRPLAHSLDVNWMQSAQYALFVFICARFGAQGALRKGLTLMLIPLIFFMQTRTARVGMKLARNLAADVPVLTQLFLGLLQAPGQVILSLDEAAYIRDLYGPGGPKIDPEFVVEKDEDIDDDAGGRLGGVGMADADEEESMDSLHSTKSGW